MLRTNKGNLFTAAKQVKLLLLFPIIFSGQGSYLVALKFTNIPKPFILKNKGIVNNKSDKNMGQAMRIAKYDRAANERQAVPALQFVNEVLQWYRLDDGVMGGQSLSEHESDVGSGLLHFKGTINTDGGGFTSVRSKVSWFSSAAEIPIGIRVEYKGDGKTYKFFLTDGNPSTGGPFARTPSWQVDIPTRGDWEAVTIPFTSLLPAFGGGPRSQPTEEERSEYKFEVHKMTEMGFMLSLRLSDGRPNPIETFGEDIFPFSLQIRSISPVFNERDL